MLARSYEKTELEDFGEKLAKLSVAADARLVSQYAADHSQYTLAFGRAQGLRDALTLLKQYVRDKSDE